MGIFFCQIVSVEHEVTPVIWLKQENLSWLEPAFYLHRDHPTVRLRPLSGSARPEMDPGGVIWTIVQKFDGLQAH